MESLIHRYILTENVFFFDNRNGSKKGESVDHNIDIAFDKIFLILYIFKATYLSKWRLLDTMYEWDITNQYTSLNFDYIPLELFLSKK